MSGVRHQLTVPAASSSSPGHKSKLMVSCWSRRKLVPFMFCERLRLILEIANRICQAISRFLIGPPVTLLRPRPCFQFSLFVHPAAGRRLTLSRALPSRQGSVSSVQCLYCSRQILSWTADSSRSQQQVGHSPVRHTRHSAPCCVQLSRKYEMYPWMYQEYPEYQDPSNRPHAI